MIRFLVDRYVAGGSVGLREALREYRVSEAPDLTKRLTRLAVAAQTQTSSNRRDTGVSTVRPKIADPPHQVAGPLDLNQRPSHPEPVRPDPNWTKPAPATTPVSAPPSNEALDDILALLDRDADVIAANLQLLRGRSADLKPDHRRYLCDHLCRRRFLRDQLRQLPRAQLNAVTSELVSAALGPHPEILRSPEWRQLLAPDVPDPLAHRIWVQAETAGVVDPLLPWLELRFLYRSGYPGSLRPVTLRRQLAGLAKAWHDAAAFAGAALLIGLVLGVVLGAWITR
jgi:hypothetical protein